MKKRNQRAAFRCMEQPAHEIFRPLAEQQQQAQALPIVPNAGDAHAATLAVATAIKPTETPGSLTELLLKNKGTTDDRKVVIFLANGSKLPRVVMLPATADEADFLTVGAGPLGTIERDDATKSTSPHTLTPAADQEANATVLAVQAALAASKPKRGMSALVNAVFDELMDPDTGLAVGNSAIVVDQTGDGNVTVFANALPDDLTGKVADVATEAAPEAETSPSLW